MPNSRIQVPRTEIIVKFREGGGLTVRSGIPEAEHLDLDHFKQAVRSIPGARARSSFAIDSALASEWRKRASRRLRRSLLSLDLFVRIRLTKDPDPRALLDQLSADPAIEYACVAGIPAMPPATPDFTSMQDYEDAAPDGVGAGFSWFYAGGDGTGVKVCDCEYGFETAHEDLPVPVTVVSNRDNDLTVYAYHGTNVLGVVGGVPDAKGVTGIAHGATLLFASESGGNRPECIEDAIEHLTAGDVLLLEMQVSRQTPLLPAEFDTDVREAVITAIGLGIVVVAAAGGGNTDLGEQTDALGTSAWDPSSAEFNDSGAIIVGAGMSSLSPYPRSKERDSNYGERVDCQGWGERVVTLTSDDYDDDLHDGGPLAQYTQSFGGTSSAAAIVAGIVADLQGAAIEAFGAPLDPEFIRELLRDPANGTPQTDSPSFLASDFPIGPLPDLARLLPAVEIYPPDVYMRDNVADTGIEPYPGAILCWSPDIITRTSEVVDPVVEFGPATWDDANLGEPVEHGHDNVVYVRMHNRGDAADNVRIDVYWTESSGFLHPATWNLIGGVDVPNIAPGEYRVADHIVWPAAEVPSEGHYCLIAVVNSVRDPITIPPAFSSVTDYLDFVRNHNNICYRNIEIVEASPGTSVTFSAFFMRGAPDRAAHFRMEMHHRMPAGMAIEMEVRRQLERYVRAPEAERLDKKGMVVETGDDVTYFRLRDSRPVIVDRLFLRANETVPVRVQVDIPDDAPEGEYLLHADQFLGDRHLGRVNFLLRVKQGKQRPKSRTKRHAKAKSRTRK